MLGLTVEEALNKDIRWLEVQRVRFDGIDAGFTNILEEELAVSENPVNIRRLGSIAKTVAWWHPITPLGKLEGGVRPGGVPTMKLQTLSVVPILVCANAFAQHEAADHDWASAVDNHYVAWEAEIMDLDGNTRPGGWVRVIGRRSRQSR